MTIHKLTAGSGYDYLTREVAAQDATERGHSGLASYHSARGEAPGAWVGRGLSGLEGLATGDGVTEEQMRNLFGSRAPPTGRATSEAAAQAGWMRQLRTGRAGSGTSTRCTPTTSRSSGRRVAARVADANVSRGLRRRDAEGTLSEDRARIRTEVAVELFREEFHRDPVDAREIAATIAVLVPEQANAVAGYD